MKPCPSCRALCHDQARFCPSCGSNVQDAASSEADPYIGHVLGDRYVLKRLIGEGGMGRVYEAEQRPLEKPVAVKILHQHLLGDEHSVARFVAEAREASRLNHPNIVSVVEFGETAYNVLFLVMEYLRGRPLSDILAAEYPLPIPRILTIFRQVLLAVGAAHQLGVIHRDLKPDNIFIEALADGSERVKVIDFGIAKRFDQQTTGLTSPGMVCGTPEYMSPEQVVGDALDPRSDVYALGVLLYELLVGAPPFLAKSAAEVMLMHAEDDPLAPSAAASEQEIPASLDAIVLWALAKERDERVGSAEEFRRVLDSWMLVSTQGTPDADTPEGVTCPSCQALSLDPGPQCPRCGFMLPAERQAEGMPYLVHSMGEARVREMRESQRIPSGFTLNALTTPATGEKEAVTPASPIVGYLPLVGREMELARLLRCVDAGGPLKLVGEPGLGKSRLLDELASRAEAAGFRVIRIAIRDDPYWPTPLWPIRQLAAELLELEEFERERVGPETLQAAAKGLGLERGVGAGLAALFGIPEPPSRQMARNARRRESFAALRDLLLTQASRRPVAVLLEDVDQMDAPTQRIISYLQDLPIQDRILLVTSQSPPLREGQPVPAVLVHPLGRDESESLACRKQSGRPLGADVYPLLEVAGGNPFYIEQLVRLVHEGGLPGQVRRRIELLDARLDRLPMHLRQALQRVAVHGGQAALETLRRAFGQSPEELDRHLAALENLGLVATGPGWVRTSHALVEEAVLAAMPAEIRREAHQRIYAVTPLAPHTVGAAVRHAVASEDDQLAIEVLDFAGGVAWGVHDLPRAIQWLQLALQKSRLLWGRGELGISGNTRVTAELARKLALVLRQQGDLRTAEAVLMEVQSLLDHEQPSLSACILMDQSAHVLERGMVSHAEEQLEKALKLSLQEEEATWLQLELLYRLADLAARRGNRERALTLFSEGFALAEQLDETGHGEAWRFHLALGELTKEEGQRDQAESYFESARLSAEGVGSLPGMLKAQTALAELLVQSDGGARARDHLAEAVRCALQLGDRGIAARLTLQLGDLAQRQRDPGAATEHYRRAEALALAVELMPVAQEAVQRTQRLAAAQTGEAPPG